MRKHRAPSQKPTDALAATAFKVEQIAAKLGISTAQVARLIEEGKLRAIDVGTGSRRFWRIPVEALDAYLQKRDSVSREGRP